MSAPADVVSLHSSPGEVAPGPVGRVSWIRSLLKNLIFFGVVAGSLYAVETGYFSNDRTSRREWNELERLRDKGRASKAYEADFAKVTLNGAAQKEGFWTFYNGATEDTVKIEGGALVLNYTSAWIGSEFRHTAFAPNGVYRLTVEANVEGEPAAVLMRNRQLDLMREPLAVSDGAFKTYVFHYVAPGGSLDRVRLIFMPDNRGKPKGKMTVRKFLIERLEG